MRIIKGILLGMILSIGLGLLLMQKGCLQQETETSTITDTIYINKPYERIVVQKIEVPREVLIYRRDTIFREQMEKDTLISGLQFTPRKLTLHSITPEGQPLVKKYPLAAFRELKVDHKGNLQIKKVKHPKRRKLFRTLGKIGLFVGGYYAGREVHKK